MLKRSLEKKKRQMMQKKKKIRNMSFTFEVLVT